MIKKVMEKKFEEILVKQDSLSDKDRMFFRKIYKWMDVGYHDYIQPILIVIVTFWLFDKIATKYGNEKSFFIMGIVIILSLRSLNSSIKKLIE